jgi:hypothetical protein
MSMPDHDAVLSPQLRTMRIILLALVLGVVIFFVIAVVMRGQGAQPAPPTPLLTYLGLGLAGVQIVLSALIPGLIVTGGRRQLARTPQSAAAPDDLRKLLGLYQTRLIVGSALLEGAAFFLLVAYLVEGDLAALGGVVVLVALLLVRFPTRPGLESWLAEQQERLSQERLTV